MPGIRKTDHGPRGGRPLVLIHGFAACLEFWDKQLPYLADRGFRVIRLDLPGHGGSAMPRDGEFSAETISKAVVEMMDESGIERAALVGHSAGGGLAQAVFHRFPERVYGLCLVSTSACAVKKYKEQPDGAWHVSLSVSQYMKWLLASPAAFFFHGPLRRLLPTQLPGVFGPGFPDEEARYWMELILSTSRTTVMRMLPAIRGFDATAGLGNISVPTLIFHGKADNIVPWTHSSYMAAMIPEAELHLLPDVGHMVMAERPEFFNETLAEWAERV